MLLTCNCLNIKLHTKQRDNIVYNFTGDFPSDEFFQQNLAEIEIKDPGIEQEHSYLVHKRQIGNWVVHKCLSCGIDSYATPFHTRTAKVLLSEKMQSDPAIIERLKQSSQFSEAFNIVLPSRNLDIETSRLNDTSSSSYESLQYHLSQIQEQLNNFILSQETAMEERIRLYEYQQREEFQQLQSKVREEKKNIISLLLNKPEGTPGPPRTLTNKNTNGSEQRYKGENYRRSESRKDLGSKGSPVKKTPLSRTRSSPMTTHSPPDQSLDTEGFFMLDESGQENEEPFYSSEEDEDSQSEEMNPAPRTVKKKPLMYSMSVPISVPKWNIDTSRKPVVEESTDEEGSFNDPGQIAASMQALAQSITNDDSRIFGDRPRPRLNTGDFNWK